MRTRNGFAMPAAIGALVIIGVLVTAGFYMARQELRISVANQNSAQAFYLAERGANDVVDDWSAGDMSSLSSWDTTSYHDTLDQGTWDVTVTKMTNRLYFLDATGTITDGGAILGGATRRTGMIVRLFSATLEPPAALTTQGSLTYGGSSEVHGVDAIPDGSSGGLADWSSLCDSAGMSDMPGILIDDTTNISWNGNRRKIEGNMTGTPLFTQDTTITAESLLDFGDVGWDEMVAMAEKVYTADPGTVGSAVTAGGECDTDVKDNWGEPTDPASPCFGYFPIIYYSGSGEFHLNSGIGQGILLVEGDLRVNGGFEFYGPVYVKGTLTTNGSGGHFWGGVVAANVNINTNTVLGNAVITYSSCALERAVLNNSSLSRARPLAMRSFIDLSAVVN